MEIKTEYSINDTVYFIAESSVWMGTITDIKIGVNSRNDIQIGYDVKCITPYIARFKGLKADRLFDSKGALIASL